MKSQQPNPNQTCQRTKPLEVDSIPQSIRSLLRVILAIIALAVGTLAAPRATAQQYSTTNYWTGAGADQFWPTPANWTNNLVPTATSLVVLTNYGISGTPGTNGSGAFGTPDIIVSNDTRLATLQVMNTNCLLGSGNLIYHTILISNGVTLTISNTVNTGTTVPNIIQVCAQSGATGGNLIGSDYGNNAQIYSTIEGAGGSLVVVATNNVGSTFVRGNIFVGQGTLGLSAAPTIDPMNAILDLSGLDNFTADANHIVLGDGGVAPFFFNRPAGTIYFAKTNTLRLWAVGNHPSAGTSANGGFLTGILAQNNGGGLTRSGRFVLGITNGMFCNSGITLAVRGCSGWMGFNASNAPGISTAYFRNLAGTGRQTLWAIGNRLGAGSLSPISGEVDFSLGTVDAQIGTLGIAVSGVANPTIGSLEFGAGTIDANVLQLGVQSATATGNAQGTLTVSNTGVLKINTSGTLGGATGTPGPSYFARLIVTNGGTATFANTAPITCGVGASTEIYVANNSALSVFTVGTASAPLTYLQLAGSTLTVDRGTASNPTTGGIIFVNNLDLSGANTINMLGPVLVVGRFPIIKYGSIVNGGFANLTLGSTSPGVTGYLTNNLANSSIDFVVTSSTTAVLTWDGQTNGVPIGNWDLNITPDWQGALKYTQAAIPGSLVRFDDTATGTTTVVITNQVAPATLLITNASKNYTFNGTNITGPTALTKDGTGSLTLNNGVSHTFSGGVFLNDGTIINGGTGNTLPTAAIVTIQNVATAGINLNNLPLQVGVLSGAGTTGGNVNLGSGTLTLSGGSGTYAGAISGAGSLVKTGTGTQTITAANLFSGGTIVSNGGLVVANGTGSGLGSGSVVVAGGVLQLGDGVNNGAITAGTITNNGTLVLDPGSSMVFTQVVYGTGSFSKADIGASTPVIQITNANFYTGQSSVNNGQLQINHPKALGTGLIALGNQLTTLDELDLSGSLTLSNNITMPGRTGGTIPSPAALMSISDPFTSTSGTNFLRGTTTLTGSTCFSLGADVNNGLIVAGPIVNSSSAGTRFFLRGGGYGELRTPLTGSISLEQWDSGGVWLLTATNTYTGATLIGPPSGGNAGTLIVDGAILGSTNLMVNSGGTLAGNGIINCAVTNKGTLSPGRDGVIGTLTISNVFYPDSGVPLNFDVGPAGNDQIRGMTRYFTGGALNINVLGAITGNCIFKLFDTTNIDTSFPYDSITFSVPDISPLAWDTSFLTVDGTLRVTGGPAVTPAITGVTRSAAGNVTLTGTGILVAPFTVIATTNLALPLADWQVVGSGTFSNGTFNFTDSTASGVPARFYRIATSAP